MVHGINMFFLGFIKQQKYLQAEASKRPSTIGNTAAGLAKPTKILGYINMGGS